VNFSTTNQVMSPISVSQRLADDFERQVLADRKFFNTKVKRGFIQKPRTTRGRRGGHLKNGMAGD
jgi:hypothetical protein